MESNNIGINFTMDDIKKKFKNAIVLSISLILAGFVLAIVIAFSMSGEDGYIRDDAPGEWIFISLIPIILGFIMLFVPVISARKLARSNRNFANPENLSPEEFMQDFQQILDPLKKLKIFAIIVVVLFFGTLFVFTLLGEISWSEFFDILF